VSNRQDAKNAKVKSAEFESADYADYTDYRTDWKEALKGEIVAIVCGFMTFVVLRLRRSSTAPTFVCGSDVFVACYEESV
jgi:hypothetical protein